MNSDNVIQIKLPVINSSKKHLKWDYGTDDEMMQEIFHRRLNSNLDLSQVTFDVNPQDLEM